MEQGGGKIDGFEFPMVRLSLDLNTTPMVRYSSLYSCLRQNKLLRMYMTNKPVQDKLHDREWDTEAEVEVSLYLTKPISKLVQTEKHPVPSFRTVLTQDLLDGLVGLCAPTLDVIKMEEVGLSARLSHMKVSEGTLTIVGKKYTDRCLMETVLRFEGNGSEELTGTDVETSDNDGL